LNFNPQTGREQDGRRPALVLSPRSYNQLSRLCVLCPITNQGKGYPFEVPIPHGEVVTGYVLSDQIKSLSWATRNAEFIGAAPEAVVLHTKAKIKALIQFS
jgi:mRNA interferase MazF